MFRFDHFSRRLFTSFQFARGYDQLENWTTIIFVRIPSVACMSHLPRPTTLSWAAYGTSPYNCTKQCVREHIYTHTHNKKKAIEQITTLFETNKEQQRNFKKLTAVVAVETNVVIIVAMVIGFSHWSTRQQVQCAPLPI